MIRKLVPRFFCEHCNASRSKRTAMDYHESICFRNPNRRPIEGELNDEKLSIYHSGHWYEVKGAVTKIDEGGYVVWPKIDDEPLNFLKPWAIRYQIAKHRGLIGEES